METWRPSARGDIVRFRGVCDRNAAEALRGHRLIVTREELPPLGPDEFYYQDVLGLPVHLPDGRFIGTVRDMFHAATDILVIDGPFGEHLVPVVEGFVLSVGKDRVVVDAERSGLDLPPLSQS